MGNYSSIEQDLFSKLDQLNKIGVALSSERETAKLMEMILVGAQALTQADGGTLYLVTERDSLRFEMVRNQSLGINRGGLDQPAVDFPEIPLYDADGQPNLEMVVCHAVLKKQTIAVADAYDSEEYDFSGTRRFDSQNHYHSKSFLTVPMMDHEEKVIGVLQLINAVDTATNHIVSFSSVDRHIVESLASQAAVAMNNGRLIGSLNHMLESFIEAIAGAIDEQSTHTGDHCRRVPVISRYLAEAVNSTKEGAFQDFSFSEEELYELNLAALLHDCGKISTPIHILDKETRQQTVCDRQELVETRLAAMRLEAENGALRGELSEEALKKRLAEIEEIRDFLWKCNQAETVVTAEMRERVIQIGEETWRDCYGKERPLLEAIDLNNYSVSHGTLNEKEREVIRNHVVSTVSMLNKLSYPRHLRRIPEIASRHHEWMNGKGYPEGIRGEEMSVQARLLCIADVFEALTATDRPYKKPMPLSKVVEILQESSDRGHLDPVLVDLFIEQKVHLRYARRFLPADQIDVV